MYTGVEDHGAGHVHQEIELLRLQGQSWKTRREKTL